MPGAGAVAAAGSGHAGWLRQSAGLGDDAGTGQRLAWAIEGTRHYGLGLARHLAGAGQQVAEIVSTRHISKRRVGKSDPVDAVRAARELLARPRPGQLRADGTGRPCSC
jgi:transposase